MVKSDDSFVNNESMIIHGDTAVVIDVTEAA